MCLADRQWQVASGVLLQMSEDRKTKERTLKVEYKDIDKQFREQLIKTKVRICPNVADGRRARSQTMTWKSTARRWTSELSSLLSL